jgi:hypothetical protein
MGALDGDRFDLLILDHDVFVLGHLVALHLIGAIDLLVGVRIDEAAAQAVARFPVQHVKCHPFLAGRRREQLHGAGDEGKLEESLPVRTRCHCKTPNANGHESHGSIQTGVGQSRSKQTGKNANL